jgi:hypothetical protein
MTCCKCGREFTNGEVIEGVYGHHRHRKPDRQFTYRYQHLNCDAPFGTGFDRTQAESSDDGAFTEQEASIEQDANAATESRATYRDDSLAQRVEQLERAIQTLTGKGETESHDTGLQHKQLPTLVRTLQALRPHMRNVWLTGSAGSGKTHAARQAADILGVPFGMTGAIDNEYKLSGFIDAGGRVIHTEFRRIWTGGGVFLFDEIDVSLPPAILAFNGALANGHAVFPDGEIKRHPDCYIIACANTWGFGNTENYVGRNKQDATTLNRFVKLDWTVDESLERQLAECDEWVTVVQAVRAACRNHGEKIAVTPRDSLIGADLIAAGFSRSEVVEMTFGGGVTSLPSWQNIGRAAIEWSVMA